MIDIKATTPVSILLVDDDDIDAMGVQRALKEHNIQNPFMRAIDGQHALELMRCDTNKIPRPFLMLLDINMPGMDGFELLDEIRSDRSLMQTIVFMLTTSDDQRDKNKAYEKHVAGYIVKNNVNDNFSNLTNMLKNYLSLVELPHQN